jgi:hypothetical protein
VANVVLLAATAAAMAPALASHPVRVDSTGGLTAIDVVDRRFNRARYDAERTVTAFAARLQDTVDPAAVRADLTGVVHAALEPTHVSVWLRS